MEGKTTAPIQLVMRLETRIRLPKRKNKSTNKGKSNKYKFPERVSRERLKACIIFGCFIDGLTYFITYKLYHSSANPAQKHSLLLIGMFPIGIIAHRACLFDRRNAFVKLTNVEVLNYVLWECI